MLITVSGRALDNNNKSVSDAGALCYHGGCGPEAFGPTKSSNPPGEGDFFLTSAHLFSRRQSISLGGSLGQYKSQQCKLSTVNSSRGKSRRCPPTNSILLRIERGWRMRNTRKCVCEPMRVPRIPDGLLCGVGLSVRARAVVQ